MNEKERIAYFYEVVVSENRLDQLPQFVSEDCVQVVGKETVFLGLEGMGKHLTAVRETYPDYTMKLVRQYMDGAYVISEFVMEGTLKGTFAGIQPTGEKLVFTGVNIDKVADGKIVEHGGAVNTFETFLEHGLIGPVSAAGDPTAFPEGTAGGGE